MEVLFPLQGRVVVALMAMSMVGSGAMGRDFRLLVE